MRKYYDWIGIIVMGISDKRIVIISDFKGNVETIQSYTLKVKSFKGRNRSQK
jgi:hypothetical protein